MYSCGPTVYDYAHIGNLRAYVASDILKRYLKFLGFNVKHVMNITDVDDKTIKKSIDEGISLKELTSKYEKAFFDDLKTLNIEKADVFPRATENIDEMIKLINILLKKGFAYMGSDNSIYYNIKKLKDYGKLSRAKIGKLKEKAKIKKDEYEKEQANDFALWKSWDEKDGNVFWNAEFTIDGKKKTVKGRPGWHIECSVMSMKYLGESFDIHSGGQDLIFPHHENEIAQSEAATGKHFVKYWVHNGWLLVDGRKMSKSLGNFYTIRDLTNKKISPRAIRFVFLSTHYREPFDFTFKKIESSEQALKRIDSFIERLKTAKGKENKNIDEIIKNLEESIKNCLDNDLDVARALEYIFNFVREINTLADEDKLSQKQGKKILDFVEKIDSVFGIFKEDKIEITDSIRTILKEREKARENKNWKKADMLREELNKMGYAINDTSEGPKLTKV